MLKILSSLRAVNSIKTKISILKEHRNNDDLKRFFVLCLDKNIQYGIKQLPKLNLKDGNEYSFGKIEAAANRLFTDKKNKKEFFAEIEQTFNKTEYEILSYILKKDPSCGVSRNIFEQIWSGALTPEMKLCKAQSFSKKNLSYIKFPAIAQTKADGARCLLFKIEQIKGVCSYNFLSSSGKRFTGLEHFGLNNTLKELPNNVVLDGELVVLSEDGTILPRKSGNGILNKSIKGTISTDEASRIRFIVWDIISYEDYKKGISRVSYNERLSILRKYTDNEFIRLIDTFVVNSAEEAKELFLKQLAKGEEGIILKNILSEWQGKRIHDQVKYKADLQCTLEVIDWKSGAEGTKYESQLGSLICASADRKIIVNVGSGLSDAYRKEFMKNPTVGFFVEIQFNAIIHDKTNEDVFSLYLPRLVDIRLDKTSADDYTTICSLTDIEKEL